VGSPLHVGRRLSGSGVVALALVVVLMAITGCGSTGPVPGPTPTDNSEMGWRDDFDAALADDRWEVYHNTYGDGNNELACLQPDNVTTGTGELIITAKQEQVTCPNGSVRAFTSGFIGSTDVGRYYPLYGRFEMRARLPHGQGLWPAFWLRHREGAARAEVDVVEMFHSQFPGVATQTLHLGAEQWKRNTWLEAPSTDLGGWHRFAVELSPASEGAVMVQFSIDGKSTLRHRIPATAGLTGGDEAHTWDMAVNLAVGGDWVGEPDGVLGELPNIGRCARDHSAEIGSCPVDGIRRANLPAQMRVDYVSYEPL
jgi:hypothetical protein